MNFRLSTAVFILLSLVLTTSCTIQPNSTKRSIPYQLCSPDSLPALVTDKFTQLKKHPTPCSILLYTNKTNYVLLTSGKKNTGGYTLRINDIVATNHKLVVSATEVAPTQNQFVPQVITSPVLVVSLPGETKFTQATLQIQKK